ncbi:MAG: hypothetical protein Ct9H90mP2_14340 [Dehalococcoidia bacterium]|nr:MAG: hypothetical protein Ct9H90mP2_14340 [Dehalococcoidia bacterium]
MLKRTLKINWVLFPGMRKMYRESMIGHQLPKDFVNLCDRFITEIENQVGRDGQITKLTRSDIDSN